MLTDVLCLRVQGTRGGRSNDISCELCVRRCPSFSFAAAWSTAISDIPVLVIPQGDDILPGPVLRAVADLVPTSVEELAACGLPPAALHAYGPALARAVSAFVRAHRLEAVRTAARTASYRTAGVRVRTGRGVLPPAHARALRATLARFLEGTAAQVRTSTYAPDAGDAECRVLFSQICQWHPRRKYGAECPLRSVSPALAAVSFLAAIVATCH